MYTVDSAFSGGGLIDLAFVAAGFIIAVEIMSALKREDGVIDNG